MHYNFIFMTLTIKNIIFTSNLELMVHDHNHAVTKIICQYKFLHLQYND